MDINVAAEQGSADQSRGREGLLKLGACLVSGGQAVDDADWRSNKNIPS